MYDTTAINSRKALQVGVAGRESGARQNKKFHIVDTHAKMTLDYGIDVTVTAAEFVKLDGFRAPLHGVANQSP